MKWYRKEHRDLFLKELKATIAREVGERFVLKYSPLAFKHSRKVSLEESRVGILNIQDIEQAALSGLVEGWANVDWDKIDKSDEPDKKLINYLSSYIERQIKREIYRDATGVAIPEYQITRTKKEQAVDKLFGNWLYSFKVDDYASGNYRYSDAIMAEPESNYSDTMELNDLLTDEMNKYLNPKERDVIRMGYGIMYKKKLSSKEMGEELGTSPVNARKRLERALNKLRDNADKKFFEKFL